LILIKEIIKKLLKGKKMKVETLIKIIKLELKNASKNELLEVIHVLNEIYKEKKKREKIRIPTVLKST